MKTTPQNTSASHLDLSNQKKVDHLMAYPRGRQTVPGRSAEEELTNRIFKEGNGKGLIRFCRELSVILIRQYNIDENVTDLREKLNASLTATLKCSQLQANCLIDLSLELIHAKVHGKYRRNNDELSYLIATATGAVNDVSSN